MDEVAAFMTTRLVVVRDDADLTACALKLLDHDFRHLPVVDEEGALVGVLADIEVFARIGFTSLDEPALAVLEPGADELTAGALCRPARVVSSPTANLLPVLRRMLSERSDCVLVVSDDKPVGILTEHDALRLAQAQVDSRLATRHCGTQPVLTVPLDCSVARAWQIMTAAGIRHLCVTDEVGVLRGVISHRDLVREGAESEAPVQALLGHQLVWTVDRTATLPEVTRWMIAGRVGCIPVVNDQDRPLSVITRTDVIDALVGALEEGELFVDHEAV